MAHKPVYVLNGPNLNLLGQREPHIYGHTTLSGVEDLTKARAGELGLALDFRQTNHEGQMVEWIHAARGTASGLVVNAGAWTHTSIAILDALKAFDGPVIEVHLSNPYAREEFRHKSFVSLAARGVICGFGPQGYVFAIEAMASLLARPVAAPN